MIQLTLTLNMTTTKVVKICQSQSTKVLFRSTAVCIISPGWSCSTYNEMTPGFKLFTILYYTNCHTFVVRIILKRWMLWTSKFFHFFYRIIVLSKYVVTILVSTDFAWWLPLTGLSWLPYAFGRAACLVAPCSSGTIPDTHLLLMGWKIILFQSLFLTCYPGYLRNMFILQSISYSLQGSYVLSVELLFPKTTTYGLHFFFFSLIFLFYFIRIFCNFSDPNLGPWFYCRIFIRSWATICSRQKYIFEPSISRFLGGNTFQHSKIKREQHWK